jgi:hypothetical protein
LLLEHVGIGIALVAESGLIGIGASGRLRRAPTQRAEALALGGDTLFVVEHTGKLLRAPSGGATRRLGPHGPIDHGCLLE